MAVGQLNKCRIKGETKAISEKKKDLDLFELSFCFQKSLSLYFLAF